ncbi:imidazolonepropionase-like domain-containing protein [Streptomyces sp. NPDC002867]
MLTIHVADRAAFTGRTDADAVAVDGGLIVAVGPYERLAGERPQARVRRWSGLLLPGLRHPQAVPLLEGAYHPDPREADELGTEPLTGDALEALAMDDTRWGASARRGLQRLLAHGVTALAGPFTVPAVRTAVARSGLRVRDARRGRYEGDALALDPVVHFPLNALLDGDLSAGGAADFAVFDVPVGEQPARALRRGGAATCVATVLGGRLVYRRR